MKLNHAEFLNLDAEPVKPDGDAAKRPGLQP